MQMPLHFPRLLLRSRIVIFLMFCALLWAFLPRQSSFFLLVRWHFKGAVDTLTANDAWLSEPPLFPVDIHDVGFIVKTGYSTQERLFARLDAFLRTNTPLQDCVVLVGDYSATPGMFANYSVLDLPVHDVLAEMMEDGALDSKMNATRLHYYSSLKGALARGETGLAQSIGESHGWELDIMKVSTGLLPFSTVPLLIFQFLCTIFTSSNDNIAYFWTGTRLQTIAEQRLVYPDGR